MTILPYLLATGQLEHNNMTINDMIADMQAKLSSYITTRSEATSAVQAVIDELQRILNEIR